MRASGEPLALPKKLSYAILFGVDWRYSLLGYAYLRCVDDVVDHGEDEAASLELLATQRGFMDAVYEGTLGQEQVVGPARYGLPFFVWDRDKGTHLRTQFEAFLDTMEFDVRRRGRVRGSDSLGRPLDEQ